MTWFRYYILLNVAVVVAGFEPSSLADYNNCTS
jgi:uncharacterized repeat protein (TIGR03987 family)